MTVPSSSIFNHISVKPLHPTFGAEIRDLDFRSDLNDEVYEEIIRCVTKVFGPRAAQLKTVPFG